MLLNIQADPTTQNALDYNKVRKNNCPKAEAQRSCIKGSRLQNAHEIKFENHLSPTKNHVTKLGLSRNLDAYISEGAQGLKQNHYSDPLNNVFRNRDRVRCVVFEF